MSSYRQILYHVILITYKREPTIRLDEPHSLYAYIGGILLEKSCHPYAINGVHDHIHLLFSLHPTVALSPLIKDIKLATSKWLKDGRCPTFTNWSKGYGAFTHSFDAKSQIIEYILNQERHHQKVTIDSEYQSLSKDHGIDFKADYLYD